MYDGEGEVVAGMVEGGPPALAVASHGDVLPWARPAVASSSPVASAQERWWRWETRAVGAVRVGEEAKVVGCGS
jgi:hypothetical protein